MPDPGPERCIMSQDIRDYLTLALLLLIVAASGMDIWSDLGHGAPTLHLMQEGTVMTLAFGLLVWILWDLRQQSLRAADLQRQLDEARSPNRARSPELEQARKRLSDAISTQFDEWGLTASEREVGWLLLKGLSLRDIAAMRDTLEKTVRQQASAIYRKADLPGRHAFAAWFIEDLL